MSSKINAFSIFTLSLLLFTLGLQTQEITGFDSRFYLFVQEMFRYGMSWFPLTYHQPYPDYPAASTVIIYFSSLFFGGLNKWTAVLPSAMLAAATVSLTYLIGSLHDRHYGYCSAMFVLLTSAFVKSARSISLDMYPVVLSALCFYLMHSAELKNKPERRVWIYPLLFISFVFRGPIGLVIPAGVVCSYYLLSKKFKQFFTTGSIAFVILVTCTGLLLALAYHVGGDVFMQNVLHMEVLGRMDNPFLPKYFYFTNSFKSYALTYPLAGLVLASIAFSRTSSLDKKLLLPLFGYMMVILIGMSIPDDKKVRYVLAITPAIALMAAYPFFTSSFLRTFFRRFLLAFPSLLLMLVMAGKSYMINHGIFFPVNFKLVIVIFGLMQIANLIAACIFVDIKKREKTILTAAAISFLSVNILVAEPVQLTLDKARDFVASVEEMRLQKKARLVFYRELPDGLPIKYLINTKSNEQPEFIRDQQALMSFSEPAFFVASASYYNDLPENISAQFPVIAKDTLAHVNVVIFSRKE